MNFEQRVKEKILNIGIPLDTQIKLNNIHEAGPNSYKIDIELDGELQMSFQYLPEGNVPRVDIPDLEIPEKLRGKGFGKALVNAAEEVARDNGLEIMRVLYVKDHEAKSFWKYQGYEPTNIIVNPRDRNVWTKKI